MSGLVINNSPDIILLSVKVTWDISGTVPSILLENLSQGPNLAGVSYAFVAKSPTTTFIHDGQITSPDEVGVWTTSIISDPWPRPFNSIEWSGSPYSFYVIAKDTNGTVYTAPTQNAFICHPNGNLPTSQNPYGLGAVTVQVKCDQARILFQDVTNASYQGVAGTIGSSVLRVNFPMDNTGTVPSPFVATYFSSAMVPITYSGKGYQFLYTSVYDYDMGDEVHIRIKYLLNDTFGVWCNIDLMPLLCEYRKLIDSITSGSCNDVEDANRKLMLINPKFSMVVMGMMQPLIGVDVPVLIQEIIDIGGFDCDCCNVASGVVPAGSSAFDGYVFDAVTTCGDVAGVFVNNGPYNIQLQLSDISYVFKICDGSPQQTTAFEVIPSTDGCQKTYCLFVDVTQLSEDILNTIKTNQSLVNLFNSIVNNSGGNFNLIVDGSCIFDSSATYDYVFALSQIPATTTFAIITAINVSGTIIPLNYAFNMTGLAGLQAYLNGLGYGTFVVASTGATTISITSSGNPSNINAIFYTSQIDSADHVATMTKTATGFTPLSANQVVQSIIDYICALCDTQVKTCAAYEICYVDEDGVKQIQTIAEGQPISEVLSALAVRGCTNIDYIVNLKAVNCENIKAVFPQVPENTMQSSDVFLGTKQGDCAGIYPIEALYTMLVLGEFNADVMTQFCVLVNKCGAGQPCAPYNVFYASVEDGSPGLVDLIITFDHPAAVSNTIRYARIDNTVSPSYITIPGVLPGDSPYTISDVANGQYRVGITPVYSDGRSCAETFYDTLPCEGITAFNAIYDGSNIIITSSVSNDVAVKVTIDYPNGGSFSQIYTTSEGALNQTIAPPANVFGTFFAKGAPVCDSDSGFIGADTAPASFIIEDASP